MPLDREERHARLLQLRKIAAEHGGTMLSCEYVDDRRAYEFECEYGHRFMSRPPRLIDGAWCRRCVVKVKRTLDDCVAWAAARGGLCLSLVYVHANYPLRWRCAEGHEWDQRPNVIRLGGWCPTCAGKRVKPVAELQKLAEPHGGALLSTSHTDPHEYLRWRCAEGHEFERKTWEVRRGRWCPRCTNKTIPWTLELVRALAASRGGEFLGRRFVDTQRPERWRCAEGHTWSTSINQINRGTWCAECAWDKRAYKRRLTLEDMRATAAEHGGECLSRRYGDILDRLRWRCAAGHTWTARASYVRQGRWCPECRAAERLSRRSGGEDEGAAGGDGQGELAERVD